MEIEMLLQDALADATQKFKDKIKEFNNEIVKKTNDFTTFVNEQCSIFHEALKTVTLAEQIAF